MRSAVAWRGCGPSSLGPLGCTPGTTCLVHEAGVPAWGRIGGLTAPLLLKLTLRGRSLEGTRLWMPARVMGQEDPTRKCSGLPWCSLAASC